MKKKVVVVPNKPSKPVAHDYAVMLDQYGVKYLKVGGSNREMLLILDSGKTVDVIKMDGSTARSRDLKPVPNGSVLEAARDLYKTNSPSVKISDKAAAILQQIFKDKEILAMARVAVATRTKAAAQQEDEEAPAPAKRGAKVAVAPAKTAKKTRAAASNGSGRVTYAGHRIRVLDRDHGAREGTKRAQGMEIIFKCKTTDDALAKLQAIGADATYLKFAMGGFGGKKLIELI